MLFKKVTWQCQETCSSPVSCGLLTRWCCLSVFLPCPQTYEEQELLRLVYFGGVEASLRKEVWPFLLGHYQFGMSEDQRKEVRENLHFQLLPAPPAEVLTLDPSPPGG